MHSNRLQNLPPTENPDCVFSDVSSSEILGKYTQLTPFLGVICSGEGESSDRDIARAADTK